MAIRVTDNNNIPRVLQVIEELNNKVLQVGIFAPEGSDYYIIAMANEYGAHIPVTPKMRAYMHYQGIHLKASTTEIVIPERSFIRAGFEAHKDFIKEYVRRSLPLVLTLRMTVDEFYGILGNIVVGKMHEYLQSVREPPNSDITIQRKRSDHPLIDTGRMTQSIVYRVVNK